MVVSVPFFWMTEFFKNPNQCFLNVSKNDLAYVFGYNVFLIILPTIGLTIFYLMIIIKLKRRDIPFGKILNLKALNSNPRSSILAHQKLVRERRLSITLSLISVIFYCCQLPTRLFLCWSYINDTMEIDYEISDAKSLESFNLFNILSHVFALVYFLHCVANPVIYNLLSSKFRKSFMSVFNIRIDNSFSLTLFIHMKFPCF